MLEKSADKEVANGMATPGHKPAVLRKIWLPRTLYNLVPWFYVSAGLLALLATIYINHWAWVVPHYILFSAVCLHIGLLILKRRWSSRNRN